MAAKSLLAVGLGLVLALDAAPRPHAEDLQWRVGLRRFGPVQYGMTLDEAARVLGQQVRYSEIEEGCGRFRPRPAPRGTSFMVVRERLMRVDVTAGRTATLSGARIGSTEQEIQALYPGQIRVEPSQRAGAEGHFLVFVPRDSADSTYGMVFETDGRTVTRFRAGLAEPVSWIDAC